MNSQRPRSIVVGTFNLEKLSEMMELLRDLEVTAMPLNGFPGIQPVPEDGVTFAENSRIKAIGIARQLLDAEILGVVADDSGIEVDALDGRPGVYSARYGGEHATDPERVQLLLKELGDLPPEKRGARFRCHIALADAEAVCVETEGTVDGSISFEAAGDFGFGYDPVFIPDGYDATFAQLGAEVKHRISHRAIALKLFRDALARMLSGAGMGESA